MLGIKESKGNDKGKYNHFSVNNTPETKQNEPPTA